MKSVQVNIAGQIEAAVVRKLTVRLVPFLFLLYIVAYLDRINVGFAALQMQQQLNFSDEVYGLGAGLMFFVGYFFFQVPSNLALQRVGARRWIASLMIVWGVISGSMMLVRGAHSFYVLRFLLGAAEAGFFPGVIFYLKTWFPAGARARTVARFMTAAPLSGVLGGPISGALLGLESSSLAGWQWMFLIEAVPAVILGGVVLVYLTDRPEEASWLSDDQREWLLETLRKEREGSQGSVDPLAQAARPQSGGTFAALGMWRVWILAAVYFGLNTVAYGVNFFLPKMIRSLSGMTNFEIGVVSAIPYIAAALAMVQVGLHSDRTGERRWHTAVSAFTGAAALSLAAYSTSVATSIILISVAVLGVFSMMGPFWAMPAGFLPARATAVGIAFINSIGNLGGGVGPYVIGRLSTSTGQYTKGLLLVSAALAIGGALVLSVKPHLATKAVSNPRS